jgi:hypothetical protein
MSIAKLRKFSVIRKDPQSWVIEIESGQEDKMQLVATFEDLDSIGIALDEQFTVVVEAAEALEARRSSH